MSLSITRTVVIDDIDSVIHYAEPWITADGQSYDQGILGQRSTTLYTGRLASPTFPSLLVVSNIEKHLSTHSSAVKGSQAYVYGTISINNSTGVPDPSWVASGTSPPFGYIENNPVG